MVTGYCPITGKQAHETPAIAKRVQRNMARFGKSVSSFRCEHCHLWHVGRGRFRPNKGRRPRFLELGDEPV